MIIFLNEELKNIDIRSDIREWAVKFNISHIALSDLLKILHHVMPNKMPLDARTLLKTNKVVICITETNAISADKHIIFIIIFFIVYLQL